MLLTKEQILKANDLPTETVPVPEWGGSVNVRTMTGREKDVLTSRYISAKEGDRPSVPFGVNLAATCICDEKGNRLFTDAEIEVLGGKSAAALDRVNEVAGRLNRLTKEERERLEKNSGAAPTNNSGSD